MTKEVRERGEGPRRWKFRYWRLNGDEEVGGVGALRKYTGGQLGLPCLVGC